MAGKRKFKVLCIETGIIYDSVEDASKSLFLKSSSSMCKCCKGKIDTVGGYHWKYYDEPDLSGEIWKDAKCITNNTLYDFSGKYLVSNMGRIKNVDTRYITYGSNRGRGYLQISIDGISHSIHRIVATTFIPNPENKPTVDHINTISSDNRVENLRWATQSEQMTENEITRERHEKSTRIATEKSKKKVKCVETGKIYNSVKEAVKDIGMKSVGHISACCRGTEDTFGGYHWEYVDKED